MLTRIFCTFTFEALHCWPDADKVPAVAYLRYPHRHLFHGRAEWDVSHHDREREFILAKGQCEAAVDAFRQLPAAMNWSCEKWATEILLAVDAVRVEVSEDGENGAIVTKE